MKFSGFNGRGSALTLTAAVAVVFGPAPAYAGGHGEKIEFSDPSTPVVESNLTTTLNPAMSRLNPNPSGFKQIQEDLFRPLKNSIQPIDSLQGVMSVPLPEPQQQQPRQTLSKRTRELLEQRRNWAFTDLNDLYPEPTMEESLGLKDLGDGKEKQSVSLIQRFYERDGQKPGHSAKQSTAGFDGLGRQDFAGTNAFMPAKEHFPELEQLGKGPFSTKKDAEDSNKATLATFTNPETTSGKVEQILAEKKHREAFERLLSPNLPATKPAEGLFSDNSPVNNSDQFSVGTILNGSGLSSPAPMNQQTTVQPYRSVINPDFSSSNPTMAGVRSHVYDDLTRTTLGLPDPIPTTTTTSLPAKSALSVKKLLDPYQAGLPKPNF